MQNAIKCYVNMHRYANCDVRYERESFFPTRTLRVLADEGIISVIWILHIDVASEKFIYHFKWVGPV